MEGMKVYFPFCFVHLFSPLYVESVTSIGQGCEPWPAHVAQSPLQRSLCDIAGSENLKRGARESMVERQKKKKESSPPFLL